MVWATKTVSSVSAKPKPRPIEKITETRSSNRRIGNRTLNRNTTPTTNPTRASAIAAYSIPVSPSSVVQRNLATILAAAQVHAYFRGLPLKIVRLHPVDVIHRISPQADHDRFGSAESGQA